jgi:hypothetical protein
MTAAFTGRRAKPGIPKNCAQDLVGPTRTGPIQIGIHRDVAEPWRVSVY